MAYQTRYDPTQATHDASAYEGRHSGQSFLSKFLEGARLVRSESMDITNDPRFFQDNVVNYRLAAFAGLAVVSGLLVQNAMDQIFDMNKRMYFDKVTKDVVLQFISFLILCLIFFLNMLSTYIGVAQPYHVIRLMTAGPTGFETAASYYLNKDIITWRHFAIRGMLSSLPLYIAQIGLRMVVKFDYANVELPGRPEDLPPLVRAGAIFFCVLFCAYGLLLYYIHLKHFAVFRDRYEVVSMPPGLTMHMQSMTTPRVTAVNQGNISKLFGGGWLDV